MGIVHKVLNAFPTLKIHSVTRRSVDKVLKREFSKLKKGKVLDVGARHSPYSQLIPASTYTRLDIDASSEPDICCDLHDIKHKSNAFDTVIATEVMEHLRDPQTAINEIHRVMKKGGVAILSTRFIYPIHDAPYDYFRYTKFSLEKLFKKFKKVEIIPHGNRIQALWQLINYGRFGIVLNALNPVFSAIDYTDKHAPLGYVIRVQK